MYLKSGRRPPTQHPKQSGTDGIRIVKPGGHLEPLR